MAKKRIGKQVGRKPTALRYGLQVRVLSLPLHYMYDSHQKEEFPSVPDALAAVLAEKIF